jgi:hypothetical protein
MTPVSDQEISEAMRHYRNDTRVEMPLTLCSSCTVKVLEASYRHLFPCLNCLFYTFSLERQQQFLNYPAEVHKHFNVCTLSGLDSISYFSLNPDLVTDQNGTPHAPLCGTCHTAITSGSLPKYCIASGYDAFSLDVRRTTDLQCHAGGQNVQRQVDSTRQLNTLSSSRTARSSALHPRWAA